jgi:hypothetical protein
MFSVTTSAALFDGDIRNQPQVNQAFGAVCLKNADHAAGRRERDEIRMLHANSAPLREMKHKWPKRVGMAKLSDFFNYHEINLMDVFIGSKPTKKPASHSASGFCKIPVRLTFAELETFASAGLAVLFALLHARIARQQPFRLQRRPQVRVRV